MSVDRSTIAHRVNQRYVTVDLHVVRIILALAILALSAADLTITQRIIGHGGIEANPVMAPIIDTPYAWALKLGIPAVLGTAFLAAPLRRRLVGAVAFLCAAYCGVVLWNLHVAAVLG